MLPVARAVEHTGNRFPAIVARLGADVYAYSADRLERLRRELEETRDRA